MISTPASLAYLAKKGITLSNYNAVTHPSHPNYIAAVAGDYFGLEYDHAYPTLNPHAHIDSNDGFTTLPSNISSVVDILEDRGISWGEYQEDIPYTGFAGNYKNQVNGKPDYVRKHNPLVIFDSVAANPDRLALIKNLTMFYNDLKTNKLPQWLFITPNMTSDGHDTSVTVSGDWTRTFLDPLLNNTNFMNNTLVLVTWDENETYAVKNRVMGILLGDVIPKNLVGTTDDTLYTHYSELSTVESNWDLRTLGRYDVGANVFAVVAAKTGDTLRNWTSTKPAFDQVYFNWSYPGPVATKPSGSWPAPNTLAVINGRTVLPGVVNIWKKGSDKSIYGAGVEVADGQHPPVR
jgi:acid phosphatase